MKTVVFYIQISLKCIANIGSDDGLSPVRHQAITQISGGLLSIRA